MQQSQIAWRVGDVVALNHDTAPAFVTLVWDRSTVTEVTERGLWVKRASAQEEFLPWRYVKGRWVLETKPASKPDITLTRAQRDTLRLLRKGPASDADIASFIGTRSYAGARSRVSELRKLGFRITTAPKTRVYTLEGEWPST